MSPCWPGKDRERAARKQKSNQLHCAEFRWLSVSSGRLPVSQPSIFAFIRLISACYESDSSPVWKIGQDLHTT